MTPDAALVEGAKRFCSLHQCALAMALWEQASWLKPQDSSLHYQLGFCHAGCRLAHRLDPELAIYHYRRALALEPERNQMARALVWAALGETYRESPKRSREGFRTALDCQQRAARIYKDLGKLDDWAREQFNLGNAWCEMPEAEFPEKWRKAVAHFTRALSFRSRARAPERYAATMQNLGTAFRELKSGSRTRNIRKALYCYHQALRAMRGRATKRKLADLHHNLGNAYLTLAAGQKNGLRDLQRALRHLALALAVRAKLPWTFDRAATQFSRGQAYLQLAARGVEEESNLREARACFADALEGFARSGNASLVEAARLCFERVADALRLKSAPPVPHPAG